MKSFGDLLKHQREKEHLSQADLAKLSGSAIEDICIIEAGQVLPSKIQMENLSSVEPLELSYQTMAQWKTNELEKHWQEVTSKTSVDPKWQCPFRRWDCPCCLWPYTLQCALKEKLKNGPTLHSSLFRSK